MRKASRPTEAWILASPQEPGTGLTKSPPPVESWGCAEATQNQCQACAGEERAVGAVGLSEAYVYTQLCRFSQLPKTKTSWLQGDKEAQRRLFPSRRRWRRLWQCFGWVIIPCGCPSPADTRKQTLSLNLDPSLTSTARVPPTLPRVTSCRCAATSIRHTRGHVQGPQVLHGDSC